jgi:hypothetical protein
MPASRAWRKAALSSRGTRGAGRPAWRKQHASPARVPPVKATSLDFEVDDERSQIGPRTAQRGSQNSSCVIDARRPDWIGRVARPTRLTTIPARRSCLYWKNRTTVRRNRFFIPPQGAQCGWRGPWFDSAPSKYLYAGRAPRTLRRDRARPAFAFGDLLSIDIVAAPKLKEHGKPRFTR